MGRIAFVFSGQGAQYSGMGKELYESSLGAKEIFDLANNKKQGLKEMCFNGSKEELSLTVNTQPCLFCTDYAAAVALTEKGINPSAVAGFSLGEIPALTFAGALTKEQGINLVLKRAEYMQKAAQLSSSAMMAVLKLKDETVVNIAKQFNKLYAVNFNCPGQVVVAGDKEELKAFSDKIKENGGRSVPLAVSGGFHSPFMNSASENLKEELKKYVFTKTKIPVYANCTASPYTEPYAKLIYTQVNSPVFWTKTINNMINDGIDIFVEVGPGKTLSGLIKKIEPTVTICHVENIETLNEAVKIIKNV